MDWRKGNECCSASKTNPVPLPQRHRHDGGRTANCTVRRLRTEEAKLLRPWAESSDDLENEGKRPCSEVLTLKEFSQSDIEAACHEG